MKRSPIESDFLFLIRLLWPPRQSVTDEMASHVWSCKYINWMCEKLGPTHSWYGTHREDATTIRSFDSVRRIIPKTKYEHCPFLEARAWHISMQSERIVIGCNALTVPVPSTVWVYWIRTSHIRAGSSVVSTTATFSILLPNVLCADTLLYSVNLLRVRARMCVCEYVCESVCVCVREWQTEKCLPWQGYKEQKSSIE